MIASAIPALAAALRISARCWWWVEKPTNFALPDFRIASAVSLNSRPLTNSIASSSVWWSPIAWAKNRSTWSVLRLSSRLSSSAIRSRGVR